MPFFLIVIIKNSHRRLFVSVVVLIFTNGCGVSTQVGEIITSCAECRVVYPRTTRHAFELIIIMVGRSVSTTAFGVKETGRDGVRVAVRYLSFFFFVL